MKVLIILVFLSTFGCLSAVAQDIVSADGAPLSMKVNEAKFIRLDRPAKAVFISAPDVADIDLQSASYLYVVGRSMGDTTLFVLGEDDEVILRTSVQVTVDTDRLSLAAQRAVGRGSVSVSAVDGALFLNGTVGNAEDAATASDVVQGLAGEDAVVVNRLSLLASSQVNLQVRIAEVSRSIREDLGISLTASSGAGRSRFGSPARSTDGFSVSVGRSAGSVNLILDALAQRGLVTILSEPNLTARSGETASFLAGGQVPIRVGATEDDTRVELETIGVELEFTPTVYDQDQIQVQLATRVRDVDEATTTDAGYGFSERSATTTIELGSGQSFAIAGMFRADTEQSFTGFPGLSSLPVIGALFRSSRYARGETELMIIVTPYVVEPVSGRNLTTPIDTVRPVGNGLEQAVTGQMSRVVRPGGQAGSRVRGAGFMLQ